MEYPSLAYCAVEEATAIAAGISKGWIVSSFAVALMIRAFQSALKLTRVEKADKERLCFSAKLLSEDWRISAICNSMKMPYSDSMSIDFTERPNREKAIRHNMMEIRFLRTEGICRKMFNNKKLYRQKNLGAPVSYNRNDILGAIEKFEDKAMEALAVVF